MLKDGESLEAIALSLSPFPATDALSLPFDYDAWFQERAKGPVTKNFHILTGDRSSVKVWYRTLPKLYKRAID